MSALTVYQGLHDCLRGVEGIQNIILGDPTTIQEAPALIIVYGSFDTVLRSSPPGQNLNGTNHEFAIRLAIKRQDNPQSEMQLITLVGRITAAIDPHLGGALNKGMATISGATTGYAEYSREQFRIADYTCTVLEKEAAT